MRDIGSAPTLTGAEDVPLCPDCCEQSGLCASHAKGVLPQLAQPHWYRMVGTHYVDAQQEAERVMGPAAAKCKRRHENRASRRLARALAGEFTPARPTLADRKADIRERLAHEQATYRAISALMDHPPAA